jgi:DNA-binding SARP family transcriptional activator
MEHPRQHRRPGPALRIELLGPLRVLRAGQPLPPGAFDRRQVPALLKYLLTAPGRTFTVPEITDAIWPTLADSAAEKSLRAAVSKLRRVLEPELENGRASRFLRKDASGYAFVPAGCALDTQEVESSLREARALQSKQQWRAAAAACRAALAHFRGEYLADEPHAPWAEAPREHWRRIRRELWQRAAQCETALGRFEAALAHCRAAVASDPQNEDAYRQWMLCAYLSGRQREAFDTYARCASALSEIGAEPAEETQRLLEQIRARRVPGIDRSVRLPAAVPVRHRAPYSLGRLAFAGRGRELAVLLAALEAAAGGEGQAVAISGEPGIGKSRLAEELLLHARDRGWQTVTAATSSAAQQEPFAPLAAVVRQLVRGAGRAVFETLAPLWRATLTRIVPELAPGVLPAEPLGGAEERRRLDAALAELFAAGARQRPLAVLIDDAHWADDESLETCSHLLTALRGERVIMLFTLRPDEAAERARVETLRAALRRPPCRELQLDYLTPAAIAAILEAMAARRSAPAAIASLAQALHARSQGNPLFLVELLQTLLASGALPVSTQGKWRVPQAGVALPSELPAAVRDVILARVARLEARERELLERLAVGDGAGLPADAQPLLDELTALGFVQRGDDGGYRLTHANIRQAVYEALPPARRRDLHRAVAAELSRVAARPQELAHHWLGAEDWAAAVAALLAAAESAIRVYAFQSAAALLAQAETALAHLAPGAERLRAELTAFKLRYRLLQEQGQVTKCEPLIAEWIRRAHALGEEAEQAQGFLARADLCAARAQWPAAVEWIEQARAVFERLGDAGEQARCWRDLGYLHWCAGALEAAAVAGERARALHEQLGNVRGLAGDLHNLAQVHIARGDLARGLDCCERARRAWQSLGSRNEEARVLTVLSRLHRLRGDLPAARECARQALALHREAGDRYGSLHCLLDAAALALLLGDAEQALAGYRAALEAAREMGGSRHEGQALRGLGLLHAAQGRDAEAAHCLTEAAARLADAGEPADRAEVCRLLGELWQRAGSPEKAAHYYRDALDYYRGVNDRPAQRPILQMLGHAYWSGGRMEAAAASCREALALATGLGERAAEGAALAALSVVLREAGQLAESRTAGEQALAIAREIGDPAAEANVQASLSETLARLGARAASLEAARAAVTLRARHANDPVGLAWAHFRLAQRLPARDPESAEHLHEARRLASLHGESALLEQLSIPREDPACPSSSSNATPAP